MFRTLISEEVRDDIREATTLLRSEIPDGFSANDFWACYGSFVLGQLHSYSDIDLIHVQGEPSIAPPRRIHTAFEGRPVTIYSLSTSDVSADGRLRKFGGYFAVKLMSPHILCPESKYGQELINSTIADFIFPFAAWQANHVGKSLNFDREQIAAHCLLAILQLCPWYESYLVRYWQHPMFPILWKELVELLSSCLIERECVTAVGADRYSYLSSEPRSEMQRQLIKCVARFWATGACLHEGRMDFPDYYMRKAEQHAARKGVREDVAAVLIYLQEKARGGYRYDA
jgi:hypothetical protein